MSKEDDAALMAAIKSGVDAAEPPKLIDTLGMATVLGQRFEHRTVEDIEEQIKQYARSQKRFWLE